MNGWKILPIILFCIVATVWIVSFVLIYFGSRRLSGWNSTTTVAWAAWVAATSLSLIAAVAISTPQSYADMDTWLEMYRYRRHWGVEHFLVYPNRPYHYWLEYRWSELLNKFLGLTAVDTRILTTLLSFAAMCAAMAICRYQLFRSRSMAYPTLAAATYLISPGGRMMIDSWNDHQPLVPFMIVGTAALLRLRNRPLGAGALALGAFTSESALHAAEPWLWGVGTVALAIAAIMAGDRRRAGQALVLAFAMATVSFVFLASVPRRVDRSTEMFASFVNLTFEWNSIEGWWRAQWVGGPWPLMAAGERLSVVCALVGLAAVVGAAWLAWRPGTRGRATAMLWTAWVATAALFPVLYETENPERYWTITVLWCLAMPRAVARLSAAARSTAAASRPVVRALCVAGLAACAAPTIMAFPELIRSSRDEHVYISASAEMNRVASPDATLIVARTGSFYTFAGYGFPGDVRMLEIGDRALDAIAETRIKKPGAPVMMLAGAVNRLLSETSPTVKLLWRLDDINPDARMFLVTSP